MNSVIEKIKAKYPDYANVPDDELTRLIGQKYPDYLSVPDFKSDFDRLIAATATPPAAAPAPAAQPASAPLVAGPVPPSVENKAMAAEMAQLREQNQGGTMAKVLGVAEKIVQPIADLATLPQRILRLPEQLAASLGQPTPYTADAPLVSPEAAKAAVEFVTPGGAASEGTAGKAAQELVAEFASGMTTPAMVGALLTGTKAPVPVGRYFQADMLSQVPASIAAIGKAETGKEQSKAILTTAANIGLPALIEKGITPKTVVVERAKEVGPATAAVISKEAGKEPSPAVSAPEPVVPPATAAGEIKPPISAESPAVIGPSVADITTGIEKVPDTKLSDLSKVSEQKNFLQKWFTAAGNLPKEVFDLWNQRGGKVSSETRKAAYAARELEGTLRQEFEISRASALARGIADVPKETIQQINDALQNKIDPNTLPEAIRGPVERLRDHVDSLSDEVIGELKTQGNEKLAATIEANKGVYLTRSYRIFDDPKYAKDIPEKLLGPVREQIARDLQENSKVPAPVESFYQQADVKLRELIADWSDKGLDKLFRQGKLGSKDLTLFMKRKDISPEMRALMGEYKDPVVNYVRSVTKMARFLGDQKFLNQVRANGLGKYLFEEGKAPAGFEHKLAADESSVMAPLNGLRTTKAIKDAFEGFGKSTVPEGVFWKAWFGLTAAAKTAKTVLSFLTQMRNLIGNPFFNVANGHFNFQDYGKAAMAQFADIAGDSKKWQTYYLDATKHRLVDESTPARELRDSLMDAGLRDPEAIDLESTGLKRVGRKVLQAPFRGYRIPDEMGKMVGWEAEKSTLSKAHPEWTEAQVKKEAAERVRNTYPTYSMVPEWVRQFRRQPLFGPFMTFAYEIFRTSYHSARYAAQDLSSGNAALVNAGTKRMVGMATALGGGAVLGALSRYGIGLTKDTEDDIRRFLPPWSDNAQLVFFSHDGTEVGYLNYSYLNPYSLMVDPIVAIAENNEQGIFERSVSSFAELIRPFTSEQMLAAAMADVARNKTERGKEVYNPQDSPDDKWRKATTHLATSIEPGSLYRLRNRIIPSFREDAPGLGRKLDPATEITAELTGLRLERFDFKDAIKFKTLAFARDERDSERIFKTEVLRNAPSGDAVATAYRAMEESRFKLWERFYGDIAAARRQGVDEDQIIEALTQSAFSRADRNALLEGTYRPRRLSRETQQWLESNQRPVPEDAIDAMAEELEARPFATQKP